MIPLTAWLDMGLSSIVLVTFIYMHVYVPDMKHRFLKGEPEVAKPKISNNSCRYEGGNFIMESDLYGIIDRSFYAMC